jgi:hypothetical protein
MPAGDGKPITQTESTPAGDSKPITQTKAESTPAGDGKPITQTNKVHQPETALNLKLKVCQPETVN